MAPDDNPGWGGIRTNAGRRKQGVGLSPHTITMYAEDWERLDSLRVVNEKKRKETRSETVRRVLSEYALLVGIGARQPGGSPVQERDAVPLALLDTPATREYLRALEAARVAAQAVDRERGWLDERGEPAGFSETVGDMADRLRAEVEGASAAG